MLFSRVFAVAIALLPAAQVLAAPSRPMPMRRGLVTRESVGKVDTTEAEELLSLQHILANTKAHIGAIKSQLDNVNADKENAQQIQDATSELKDAFDSFVGDLKSLKAAKVSARNQLPAKAPFTLSPSSWPILSEAYDLVKDVITVVDEIQSIATTGDVVGGVTGILWTVVGAVPTVVSLVTSILAFF
ncbi:hypothetical protein FRC09_010566 [Ceratobasidium sp. 395]|nr:hypothetical protein FRC09_010566 [Ceratobasidium sp. 395]